MAIPLIGLFYVWYLCATMIQNCVSLWLLRLMFAAMIDDTKMTAPFFFFLATFDNKMLSLVKPKAMQFHSVEVCGKYFNGFRYYSHSKTKRTEGPFTLKCLLILNEIMIGRNVLRRILEKFVLFSRLNLELSTSVKIFSTYTHCIDNRLLKLLGPQP